MTESVERLEIPEAAARGSRSPRTPDVAESERRELSKPDMVSSAFPSLTGCSALIRRKRSSGSTPNLVSPSKSKTKTKNVVESMVNDPASVARSARNQPVGDRQISVQRQRTVDAASSGQKERKYHGATKTEISSSKATERPSTTNEGVGVRGAPLHKMR